MSFTEYYNDLASDQNNLSFWLPKVEKCGLRIPKTAIVRVPENIAELFFMEKTGMTQTEIINEIHKWVTDSFMPTAKAKIGDGLWFIKNGTFSNKFDFSKCFQQSANPMKMTDGIIDINYTALMFGADGITEMVAREYIQPPEDVPCIYHGMPMRTEVRVFYDFTNHHVIYAVNYWDESHCREAISRDATDKIVYDAYYPVIEARYNAIKNFIINIVELAMKDITGLTGVWSIDVLDNNPVDSEPLNPLNIWLTDMAMGQNSAYWDIDKVVEYGKSLKEGKETVWVP